MPVCVLLDVSAALAIGTRFSRDADKSELKWMAPAAVIGAVLGVTLLVSLPRQATLTALGLFLLAHGGLGRSKTRVGCACAHTGSYLSRLIFSILVPSMRIKRVGPARLGECRSPSL